MHKNRHSFTALKTSQPWYAQQHSAHLYIYMTLKHNGYMRELPQYIALQHWKPVNRGTRNNTQHIYIRYAYLLVICVDYLTTQLLASQPWDAHQQSAHLYTSHPNIMVICVDCLTTQLLTSQPWNANQQSAQLYTWNSNIVVICTDCCH